MKQKTVGSDSTPHDEPGNERQRPTPEAPVGNHKEPSLSRRALELARASIASLALAIALGCAVIAIAEVSSRQTIAGLLNDLERDLAQRFAASAQQRDELARMALDVTREAHSAPAAAVGAAPNGSLSRTDARALELARLVASEGMRADSARAELESISRFRRRLQQLELTGGAKSQATAGTLMAELAQEQRTKESLEPLLEDLLGSGAPCSNTLRRSG